MKLLLIALAVIAQGVLVSALATGGRTPNPRRVTWGLPFLVHSLKPAGL